MIKLEEDLFDAITGSKKNKTKSSERRKSRIKSTETRKETGKRQDLRDKLLAMGYDADTAEMVIFRSELEPEITAIMSQNVYNSAQYNYIRAIMKNQSVREYKDEDGISMLDILKETNPSESNLEFLIYVAESKLPFYLILEDDFKTFKSDDDALASINNYSDIQSASDQSFSDRLRNLLDKAERSGYNNAMFLSLKRTPNELVFYDDSSLSDEILMATYLAQGAKVSGQEIKNVLLNSPQESASRNLVNKIEKNLDTETLEKFKTLDNITLEQIVNISRDKLIQSLVESVDDSEKEMRSDEAKD